jgi:DNA-directed RNA polymerase specialized sigma24 family protein
MGERAVVEDGTRTEPEPGSMAELYARYVPGGIRLAFLTGDRNRADDLAHEAFVRCVGRFAHLRAHRAFEAYLRRAIVNLHTSGIRHRYAERVAPARGSATGPRNRLPPRRRGSRGSLEGAGNASARQRGALVLRYYEDLSENDTAGVLGCSVAAVKSLVARGSETLRTTIAQGEDR